MKKCLWIQGIEWQLIIIDIKAKCLPSGFLNGYLVKALSEHFIDFADQKRSELLSFEIFVYLNLLMCIIALLR